MEQIRSCQLTSNFNLLEFFPNKEYHHTINVDMDGIMNDEFDNIKRLASVMQNLRDRLGVPIRITSGYRTLEQNKNCQGAKNSYHLSGCACDFRCRRLADAWNILKADENLAEVIYHKKQGFIHVAIRRGRGDNKHYVHYSYS